MQKAGKKIKPNVYYILNSTTTQVSQDDFVSSKPFFNAKLVGTIMSGMNLELNVQIPLGAAIYMTITATYGTNGASKTFGPFYLKEKATYNADTKTYTHEAYDYFIKTMVDYKTITLTYPTTVFAFFSQLVSELGLTTDITSLPNGTRTLNSDIYTGINYTFRDVLDDIGQATGTAFKMDNLIIKKASLGTTEITVNDDILKNQNIAFGQHFGPINSVILARSGNSDIIYKRDETATSWNEFKIENNQLMNNNDRDEYLSELYTALYGIEYDIFDTELIGYGGFEPFDKVKFSTIKNGTTFTYSSYVFNDEQTFTQGYTETIYTDLPTESNTDYKTSDTTDKRLNQAYILVNKQKQTIESLTSQVTSIDTTVGNNYQTILKKFDNYATTDSLSSLQTSVATLQTDTYTKTEVNQIISGTSSDGTAVSYVTTSSGTFDEKGLHIAKTNEPTTSTLDWDGLTVTRNSDSTNLLSVESSGVESINLTARNFLIKKPIRMEKTTSNVTAYKGNSGLGFFYIGDD
jgi:hypothetical protein